MQHGDAGQGNDSDLGRRSGMEQEGVRFNCELSISGISHLVFLDYSGPWVTKTLKSKTKDWGLLSSPLYTFLNTS